MGLLKPRFQSSFPETDAYTIPSPSNHHPTLTSVFITFELVLRTLLVKGSMGHGWLLPEQMRHTCMQSPQSSMDLNLLNMPPRCLDCTKSYSPCAIFSAVPKLLTLLRGRGVEPEEASARRDKRGYTEASIRERQTRGRREMHNKRPSCFVYEELPQRLELQKTKVAMVL